MLGIGRRKIAKSVMRPTAEVNSHIVRVSRHHDAVFGWIVDNGMHVMLRRTPWMTVQKPTNISPQKQMDLRCGLGKIRLY
jgi:hypothetical protein